MEFFVPHTSSPEEAESVWSATRAFARDTMQRDIGERRIFRLRYTHNGEELVAEVGRPDPLTSEPVMVILESDPYLICTPNRGVLRGEPILAGAHAVRDVEDFDLAARD